MSVLFQYLTEKQRKELSPEEFGDPELRMFPILTQEDVDKAPLRVKALSNADIIAERIKAIATRKGFVVPEAWGTSEVENSEFSNDEEPRYDNVAEFELDASTAQDTEDGKYVYRTGKIFEAGQYPDKKFELSPEEMCEAIADFKPVDIDMEHMPTIMDGKIGKLEAVALASDGRSLIGTVKVPKWLDDNVLKDVQRKVSATWDRVTKRLTKLAFVRNPRVKDAVLLSENAGLFAAFMLNEYPENLEGVSQDQLKETVKQLLEENPEFASARTWDGKYLIQGIHDTAARAGAVCVENEKKFNELKEAGFVSAAEAKNIQQIHDTALRGGAVCNFMKSDKGESSYYSDEKENIMSLKDIKNFLLNLPDDMSLEEVKEKAELSVEEQKAAALEKKEAELAEAEKALAEKEAALAAKEEELKATPAAEEEETTPEVENSDEPSEREKQLEAELAELRMKDIVREAESFADAEIRAERAFPAERPMMIAAFTKALQADKAGDEKVKFNNGKEDVEASNVELLKSLYAVRKPHNYTFEEVSEFGLNIAETDFANDGVDSVLGDAVQQAKEYAARKNRKLAASQNN